MDEIVLRAMARWPNVPAVFGWLRLDRRGRWLLRTAAGPAGRFEPIGNVAFGEFISRNYQSDEQGRWYFQNGPQRVFVGLDGAPWVFRLDDAARHWVTHTGIPSGNVSAVLFAGDDRVLLATERGLGDVLDRDLSALFERLTARGGGALDPEVLLASLRAGGPQHVELDRHLVSAEAVAPGALPERFGYVAEPEAPAQPA